MMFLLELFWLSRSIVRLEVWWFKFIGLMVLLIAPVTLRLKVLVPVWIASVVGASAVCVTSLISIVEAYCCMLAELCGLMSASSESLALPLIMANLLPLLLMYLTWPLAFRFSLSMIWPKFSFNLFSYLWPGCLCCSLTGAAYGDKILFFLSFTCLMSYFYNGSISLATFYFVIVLVRLLPSSMSASMAYSPRPSKPSIEWSFSGSVFTTSFFYPSG